MNDRPNDRRRRVLPLLPLLLSLVIFAPGCRKPAEEVSLIRLIDILDREGVVDSPILDLAADPKAFARNNPNVADMADKFPLLDEGVGQNPLLLKKKMQTGSTSDNVILAPPKSVLRFKLRVPRDSLLEFNYGLYWGKDPAHLAGGTRRVDFLVRLRARDRNELVFYRSLTLTSKRSAVFNHKRIDLSRYAGQDVNLEFTTRGQPDTLALWYNPIIFRPQPNARNVILVSLDTLRADHLSCYGYGRATSPNMDRMAAESVLFKNTFAPAPWTLPSHVSMLTGLDPVSHGVYHSSNTMDPAIPTLADFLRRRGFLTAAFTGGGFVSGIYGLSKGFDNYRVVGKIASAAPAGALARAALPWIEDHRQNRFFLFLHTYQIHQPYYSPAPFNTMFLDPDATLDRVDLARLRLNHENRFQPVSDVQRRNFIGLYDAEIRYTDEALIGPLVGQLKKLGLYDQTMIIVTADHGEEFYEHKSWTHTQDVYNATIKVPLLVKFPASRDRGRTIDRFARLTDIMPTILEEMGIESPRNGLDGRSLSELVRGKGPKGVERMFRCELAANVIKNHIPRMRTVNRDFYKIILNDVFTPEQLSYFLCPPPNREKVEIYDLAVDPEETTNLALSRPGLARSLLDYLEKNLKPTRKREVRTSAPTEDVQEELKALGYIR